MRTIKSQDGKMIVNAEKMLGNCVYENDGEWFISVFDTWLGDDTVGFLAEYSTEKRALRVLDMLNEWLTENAPQESEFNNRSAYASYCLAYNRFQMPQDSEELDA